LARAFAAVLVLLAGAVAIVVVVFPSWTRAQLDTVVVLAITERTPAVASVVRLLTDAPRIEEIVVARQPTTLVRPGEGHGPWPTVVFVNGATRAGRFHPKVRRLAQGLARAGFLVAVPDLPGLRLGEITPATTGALVRVTLAVAGRPDVRGRRVSFYGVSVGATLALLAAEATALGGRVQAVGGEAPWVDLEKVIRLATTGYYGRTRYRTDPYVRLAIARSLSAGLPNRHDRRTLLSRLEAVPDDDPRPLAPLHGDLRLRAGGRSLVSLLLNRNAIRFRALYARLPAIVRGGVASLSPLLRAGRLDVPVEIASAPHDKYFPPAESRALAEHSAEVRVTVTRTLAHAVPHLSGGDVVDLFRFSGFLVRGLHAAR
jgi:pimeloyl-ACP methyl ester carboxylesterase